MFSVPVNHRPRHKGVSKYGVLDQLGVGIVDLLGVMWLQRRAPRATPLPRSGSRETEPFPRRERPAPFCYRNTSMTTWGRRLANATDLPMVGLRRECRNLPCWHFLK